MNKQLKGNVGAQQHQQKQQNFTVRLAKANWLFRQIPCFLLAITLCFPLSAQLNFTPATSIPVVIAGDTLPLAWTGGLNFCQFSSLDIDLDGTQDLLVFDRSGDRGGAPVAGKQPMELPSRAHF